MKAVKWYFIMTLRAIMGLSNRLVNKCSSVVVSDQTQVLPKVTSGGTLTQLQHKGIYARAPRPMKANPLCAGHSTMM